LSNPQPTTPRRPERQTHRGRLTGYEIAERLAPERGLALDAWGDHLDRFDWKLYTTTTYRGFWDCSSEVEVHHPAEVDSQGVFHLPSTGVKELHPRLWHPVGIRKSEEGWAAFIRHLRHQLPHNHRVEFFRVTEPHKTGSLHHHALILGNDLEDVNRNDLREWCWDHIGKAHIARYDSILGARYYLGKYLHKRDALNYAVIGSARLARTPLKGEGEVVVFEGLRRFHQGRLIP